jgi:hypothetical protein
MAVTAQGALPFSDTEKAEILRQTERLLASRHFSGSKRYPALLRYVIQQTLDGHQETLKERTLGIEIFGRDPGFDTSGDPIVRVTASEVRKRIAQYYQDEGHDSELRIEMPSGSYVPQFRLPHSQLAKPAPEPVAKPEEPAKTTRRGKRPLVVVLAILLVLIPVFLGLRFWRSSGARDDLLKSFWTGNQAVIICMGAPILTVSQPGADNPEVAAALGPPTINNTLVPLSDAITMGVVQDMISSHHRQYRVLLARRASLDDLRSGPTVLIGALDNPWTMRLTAKLRFQFYGAESAGGGIVDSKSNGANNWTVDFHVPYSDRTQDYAIVALTQDDMTGQPLLIVAGAGPNGTRVAGEFLMNEDDMAALKTMAPKGWRGGNFEVVLATQVIQGNSAPPRIVASQFW